MGAYTHIVAEVSKTNPQLAQDLGGMNLLGEIDRENEQRHRRRKINQISIHIVPRDGI